MRLLLDTHIWIWSQVDPAQLVPKVKRALSSFENELWYSPISIWEFLLLVERKRLRIKTKLPISHWIEKALNESPIKEAPINRQVSMMTYEVILEHNDPADRFLAATAAVYDLTLVTSDEKLLRGKGYRTLDNV